MRLTECSLIFKSDDLLTCIYLTICRYRSLLYTVCGKKVSTKVVVHFLSNHVEVLRETLRVCYVFIYRVAQNKIPHQIIYCLVGYFILSHPVHIRVYMILDDI